MYQNVPEIRKKIKSKLSVSRYEHTLGVAYTCMALAMRYGYPLDQAELAGLLHDCAKEYNLKTSLEKCQTYHVTLTEHEYLSPVLIHAKLGATMAEQKYGIRDQEVLQAIRCHTTGKPNMGLLDKLLYVADYIEPRRHEAPDLENLRRLAFVDLDLALYQMLEASLQYILDTGRHVDPMTQQAYEYYKRIQEDQ